MARYVAELLPRAFEVLELSDVRGILAARRDERETLFFERKEQVTGESLAKACAAFANTMGGLLVIGVPDDQDELVGIEPVATEAQLWVKDVLRARVLPMPPFRARWLPVSGERGLLLVLVEESTSTPHLLTRSGAIYVRNPGSSDPMPLSDQQRLLDLMRRGEAAERLAQTAAEVTLLNAQPMGRGSLTKLREVAVLASTGVTADFETRIFHPSSAELVGIRAWDQRGDGRVESRWPEWGAEHVGMTRILRPQDPFADEVHEGVSVLRTGVATFYRGVVARPDTDYSEGVDVHDLRSWLERCLSGGRALLAELGGHGRLRLAYRLDAVDDYLMFRNQHEQIHQAINVSRWTSFGEDDVVARVFDEIARNFRLGPGDVVWE